MGDVIGEEAIRKKESSISTEEFSSKMGELKQMAVPNLPQLIDQKTWENDQLRQELDKERDRYRASHRSRTYIAAEASQLVKSLQQVLLNFQELQKEIESEQTFEQ